MDDFDSLAIIIIICGGVIIITSHLYAISSVLEHKIKKAKEEIIKAIKD